MIAFIDWPTILLLFMGLFVVTSAFRTTGYGGDAVHWLAESGVSLRSPAVLTAITATLSNLIGNSAAVMLSVKVADVTHRPDAYVLALAGLLGWVALVA